MTLKKTLKRTGMVILAAPLFYGLGWLAINGQKANPSNQANANPNLETRVESVREAEVNEPNNLSYVVEERAAEENAIKANEPIKQNNIADLNDKFSYLKVYESIINKCVAEFNKKHNIALDPNVIKAMITVESGSEKDRKGAFRYDPMQIANQGDYALETLANAEENTYLIGDFSRLKGKNKTPWDRKKKCWDYSNSNMAAEDSVYGGIGWLLHKAAIYDERIAEEGDTKDYVVKKGDSLWEIAKNKKTTVETIKKYSGLKNDSIHPGKKLRFRKARKEMYIEGWESWGKAAEEYNGGGNPNYLKEVRQTYKYLTGKNLN